MIRLTCSTRELSRLIHTKRVRIDPSFRGELIRLFDNPKARMAYFSKHGLSIDDLGEAIFDAGLCFERPTCDDVLETLESLFTPGVVRQVAGKRESAQVLMGGQADLFDFGLSGTPTCAHRFDPCEQLTLEGGTARICTLCGESES